MPQLPALSHLNFEHKRYKAPAVPQRFSVSRKFGEITPADILSSYAWAVEVTTGVRLTPIEAATLLKHLHPFMQDPDFEMETNARETVLSGITHYLTPNVNPVRAGTLMNILAPDDLPKIIKTNRQRLQPTAQNIFEMARYAVMKELGLFNEYLEDFSHATLEARALKMIQVFYPEIGAEHLPQLVEEFSKSAYPGLTAIQTAFITGNLGRHLKLRNPKLKPYIELAKQALKKEYPNQAPKAKLSQAFEHQIGLTIPGGVIKHGYVTAGGPTPTGDIYIGIRIKTQKFCGSLSSCNQR